MNSRRSISSAAIATALCCLLVLLPILGCRDAGDITGEQYQEFRVRDWSMSANTINGVTYVNYKVIVTGRYDRGRGVRLGL